MPKPMTSAQLDAFLDEPHVAIIATISKDGTPNPQPIWYLHRDGVFYLSTEGSSVKGKNIARDARISLCVQQETVPYKSVTVWGTAAVSPHDTQISRAIAIRYLGEQAGAAYDSGTTHDDAILLTLRPDRVFSQDYTTDFGAAS